jgi:hypothetical protein
MADYGIGFLGQYISAAELVGKRVTVKIDRVELEEVEPVDDGKKKNAKAKDRWIIYFSTKNGPSKRGWLLNRTNAECLKAMWGRETTDWVGHSVTLHTEREQLGPAIEPGIRVLGSPDITAPLKFDLKLPKKKAKEMTLLPTGKQAPAAEPEPEPESADEPAPTDA